LFVGIPGETFHIHEHLRAVHALLSPCMISHMRVPPKIDAVLSKCACNNNARRIGIQRTRVNERNKSICQGSPVCQPPASRTVRSALLHSRIAHALLPHPLFQVYPIYHCRTPLSSRWSI
jgi:hypothetical protein